MHKYLLLILLLGICIAAEAQPELSGTVLDNSKKNYVEGVRVVSSNGHISFTDSLGHYSIPVAKGDSIFFMYNNKPTQKFAVSTITNLGQFDISLPITVRGKYTVLKEVTVFSKSYKQDSAENRETYNNVFSYHKPRVETSITPGGGVGMDLNELVNMFRFRRNRNLKAFQKRVEADEQEKYVNYRFSKKAVHRITQLNSPALDTFLVWYRPSYEFVAKSSEITFNQYVLNAYYQFHRLTGLGELKEEQE